MLPGDTAGAEEAESAAAAGADAPTDGSGMEAGARCTDGVLPEDAGWIWSRLCPPLYFVSAFLEKADIELVFSAVIEGCFTAKEAFI